jgi:catechol 2,3-dioxygenase-like lactoylglutathione lyase family enzyme
VVGYVTIGSNDFEKAVAFYDALLGELGAKRFLEMENFILWTLPGSMQGGIAVVRPYDGKPATVGNGMMVAITANSPAQVDELHAKALALGGSDEGAPGPRGVPGFYVGYFRDLDGNKLNVYATTQEG